MCASARTKTVGFSGDELVLGGGGLFSAPSFGRVIRVCERARSRVASEGCELQRVVEEMLCRARSGSGLTAKTNAVR